MLWSGEEMLDGEYQRAEMPVRARAARGGLRRKEWKSIFAKQSFALPQRPNRSRQGVELN